MMIIYFLAGLITLTGCSHSSKIEKLPEDLKSETKTVEIPLGHEKEVPSLGPTKKEEFAPYRIKANRNKSLALQIGKLEDRMFVAIGIIKWLERNGYRVEELQVADENESRVFSHLIKRKSSHLEWKLHQCCKEDFPLSDVESYREILSKFEEIGGIGSAFVEDSNCNDFQQERYNFNVVCIGASETSDHVEISRTIDGMKLIKIEIAPVNYNEKFSFVDYVERGHGLGAKIKNN